MSAVAKPAPYEPKPTEANNPMGTVALVLGILGLFSGCPISLAAMITGWMGMKQEPSGMARVGFWLGAAATVLQVIVLMVVLVVFGAAFGIGYTATELRPESPAPPVPIEMEAVPGTQPAAPAVAPVPPETDTLEIPDGEVVSPAP